MRMCPLERVAEAELELPFGGIGGAFVGHVSKRAAGWAHVGIIPVGVVDVVEGLCLEDQLMVLMARDDVEALLERGIEALEAGAVDDVAGAARGKGADGGGLKDTGLKPLGGAGGTEPLRQ